MKRVLIIFACVLFSSVAFAQLDGDFVEDMVHNPNKYIGKQQKEIGNAIRGDIENQIRQQQAQAAKQQAVQNFNNRISAEGQNRMEYHNNPDNYIDRSITNRSSSAIIPDDRRNLQNQQRDLRTQPIHSESLNSKSLQSLRDRDINRNQFSSLDEIDWDRDVYVKLFEKPKLQERPFVQKPSFEEWAWNEYARRMKLENEVASRNDMIDLTKKGLGLVGGVLVKGSMSVGALLSANLNLYSELAKYWNECSSGARIAKTSDTFEILGKAALNTIVDVAVPWVGDEVGVAYLGVGKMGTDGMRVFNSMQIGLSLSDFAVNNEKSEE